MLRSAAVRLSRATVAAAGARTPPLGPTSCITTPTARRFLHDGGIDGGPTASPVALQMIDYALSLAKSQNSDESYSQSLLVLEQCLASQSTQDQDVVAQNSKGLVLLAMSNLLFSRGNYNDAMEKLQLVQDLALCSLAVRVAAAEALIGLNLELGHDDTSSVLADKYLEFLEKDELKSTTASFNVVEARVRAIKGLVELVLGNLESAESFFHGFQDHEGCVGNAALSYGEFLHANQNFPLAKELYQRVIKEVAETKDFTDIYTLAPCNMASKEVLLGATCALGQLEAHMGNFGEAEETLTGALNKAEQHFGGRHPKVGVVLTSLALMYRHKAIKERSSSLLIQEGLYRRALELQRAPSLDSEGDQTIRSWRDIITLARGGYAEALCVQENRKAEGKKMKMWAEAEWRNNRLSLAEALKFSESSNVPVIDTRIGRAL